MLKKIKTRFSKNKIKFSNEKKSLNWIRKLKPKTLFRIGDSYFADKKELDELLAKYSTQQIETQRRLRKQRAQQARKNFGISNETSASRGLWNRNKEATTE